MDEKKTPKKIYTVAKLVVSALVLTGLILGSIRLMGYRIVSGEQFKRYTGIEKTFGKLYDMKTAADETFLWDFSKNDQMNALYTALMDSYGDKYTKYLDEDAVKELKEHLNSSFYGIGIQFKDSGDSKFEIVEVVKEGPADVAGIKKGDLIKKVDGASYTDSDKLKETIRGKLGSNVKLVIEREGKEKEFNVTRGEVSEATIDSGILQGNIGYIRIRSFGENTSKEFDDALSYMEKKALKGVIIDLRNNPGGLFESGIDVADSLLPECNITYTKTKAKKKENYNSDEKHTSLKYVLLVNENTASSAEVLAAAIKANKGGSIVGTKTFGKGIVQETRLFKDGTGISVTTREYYAPDGSKIHKKGITPDVEVNLTSEDKEDVQLLKAMSLFS